jgi:hypothetical protein
MIGIRAIRATSEPDSPPRPVDRDVARLLALLEDQCAEAVTITELRERGIAAPAQAIYTLQLTGYEVDRVPIHEPCGAAGRWWCRVAARASSATRSTRRGESRIWRSRTHGPVS